MKLSIRNIQNEDSLFSALRRIDISVPARAARRCKRRVETRVICHLLATLAKASSLHFPLSLDSSQRERPDFLTIQDNKTVGVEVTEAIPEDWAEYVVFAERNFPAYFLEPGHFSLGKSRLEKQEWNLLKSLPHNRLTAQPFYGTEPENIWASFLHDVIDGKLTKLRDDGFKKFDENWLAIYDDFPITVSHDEAIALLKLKLRGHWLEAPIFDVIFIQRGSFITRITTSSSERIALHDLWNQANDWPPRTYPPQRA